MPNRLDKLITAAIPGHPSVPPTEGVVGHPAYCLDRTYPIVVWYPVFSIDDNPLSPTYRQFVFVYWASRLSTAVEHNCFPAVTATPGDPGSPATDSTPENFRQGWNAGAISIDSITGDGQFQFSIDANTVGIVTGLNDTNEGTTYAEINYGLYFASGTAKVMERGVVMGGHVLFAEGDVFTIARSQGRVEYFQNSTLIYTSLTHNTGPLFADASMYFGRDAIIDASLDNAVDPAFIAKFYAGDGGTGGGLHGDIPPLGGVGGVGVGGSYITVTGAASDAASGNAANGAFKVRGTAGDFISFYLEANDGNALGDYGDANHDGIDDRAIFADLPGGSGGGALGGGSHAIASGQFAVEGQGSNFAYSEGRGTFAIVGLAASANGGEHGDGVEDDDPLPGPNYCIAQGSFRLVGEASGFDAYTTTYAHAVGSFELAGYATGQLITPPYAEARGAIPMVQGFAYGSDVQNIGSAQGSFEVISLSSNFAYSEARGSFTVESISFERGIGYLVADLPWRMEMFAFGRVGNDVSGLYAQLPGNYMLTGYGGGRAVVTLPVPTLSATGTVQNIGRLDSELPVPVPTFAATVQVLGRLDAQLPIPALTGYGGGVANVELPVPTLAATGTVQVVGRLNAGLPVFSMVAYGGARATVSLPLPTLSATGSVQVLGRLNAELPVFALTAYGGGRASMVLPVPTLSVTGTSQVTGRLVETLPTPSLVAYAGGHASMRLPTPSLSASGTVWIVGRLNETLPTVTFTGAATVSVLGRLDALLPAMRMVAAAKMNATLPVLTLLATGVVGSTSPEYEAYSITLIDGEAGTEVAVTRLDQYPFDRIHRWRGKYYGVARDGVYELQGDTFDGDPIVATIRTAKSDLGHQEWKRVPDLFITGSIGDDIELAILADDVSYPMTAPIKRPNASRSRAGKGIKGHYIAFEMSNAEGEYFSIDAFTPQPQVLRRTL